MKKSVMFGLFILTAGLAKADLTSPAPLQSVTDQFNMAFLQHISAVDSFRQDGSHVIKFEDGIIQAVPYKKDHLLIGSFGLIPRLDDSAKFDKSYSIHVHVFGFLSQFVDVNQNYAPILSDLELTPGYSYDQDLHHGGFEFSVGYSHQFGA